MKAVVLQEFGAVDKLCYIDFPTPETMPDEVLVRVKACSVNHLDIWIRNGIKAYNTRLPHILGADIAGSIEAVGAEVSTVSVGENVVVFPGVSCFSCLPCYEGNDNLCRSYSIMGAGRHGGYAEFVAVKAVDVMPMPANISFEEAAAFPLTFLTSWHMLLDRAGLKAGETLLVLGAGSGVGSAAIQIGKLAGAMVIAVAGSDKKLAKASEMGADHLINYRDSDFYKSVMRITEKAGVDLVFEHVGPSTWEKSIRSLKKGGRLVTCGATSGPEVRFDLRYLFSRQLSVFGSIMGKRAELIKIAGLVGEGKIKPVVDSVFGLADAARAHEKMESRDIFGKIILVP